MINSHKKQSTSTDTAPPTTMLHTQPLRVAERSSNMKMWFEIFLYTVRAVPGGHRKDFADRERDSRTGRFLVKPRSNREGWHVWGIDCGEGVRKLRECSIVWPSGLIPRRDKRRTMAWQCPAVWVHSEILGWYEALSPVLIIPPWWERYS